MARDIDALRQYSKDLWDNGKFCSTRIDLADTVEAATKKAFEASTLRKTAVEGTSLPSSTNTKKNVSANTTKTDKEERETEAKRRDDRFAHIWEGFDQNNPKRK